MSEKKSLQELFIRSVFALIGTVILALGISILQVGNVGLDPFTSANVAIGQILGLSLGVYQLIMNVIILVMIFFFGRKYIGIGTIINLILTGFFIDLFSAGFAWMGFEQTTVLDQLLSLVLGLLVFSFGASFYMSAEVGTAPYDAISPTIVDKTKLGYRTVRIIQDLLFASAGFLFKGPIGIGTFVTAFLMGPFIKFWDQKVSLPLINKSVKKWLRE
ncbi:YczE/YyaS/YitT family protein [Enterococcus olivae]